MFLIVPAFFFEIGLIDQDRDLALVLGLISSLSEVVFHSYII